MRYSDRSNDYEKPDNYSVYRNRDVPAPYCWMYKFRRVRWSSTTHKKTWDCFSESLDNKTGYLLTYRKDPGTERVQQSP